MRGIDGGGFMEWEWIWYTRAWSWVLIGGLSWNVTEFGTRFT